ncbi:MAG: hypothetical protein IPL97_11095 [Niastella sp.]|nr:hypothetical protein [Niastella sp.]
MGQITALLALQNLAGLISLAGALAVVLVIIFLIATSSKSAGKPCKKHTILKIKPIYFWGIIFVLAVVIFLSIRYLSYPRLQDKADEVVTVVGIQWDWQMANGISDKSAHEFVGKNEILLPVNKKIKFIITSDDVTHSFSIYNNKGVLLTQTQAIPQYRNELFYIFSQKGDYTILCLEYCGLVHPFMSGIIHVE